MKAPPATAPSARYELPRPGHSPDAAGDARTHPGGSGKSLSGPMLVANAAWFCRLRWTVIAILLAFGLLGAVDKVMEWLGLRAPGSWPFVAAAVLALGNVCYLAHIRSLRRAVHSNRATINLWSQIVLDLLVLTAVIHFVGSVVTGAAFAYVFHIALACIFFSRRQSLAVTVLASVLYVACLSAEHTGVISPTSIFADTAFRQSIVLQPGIHLLNFLTAVAIWLVVWYLASHLSLMVRRQDTELTATNRYLVAAQEERARHMLTTTHQLKAPFAAIHANMQLLLKGHCGTLPEQALDVVQRVAARCRRLAAEIQDMLQLANLSSAGQKLLPRVDLDLCEALQWCIGQVQPTAQEREVVIEADLQPARTVGVEDHLKMVFVNLLSNAVAYSHKGGRVRVLCCCPAHTGPVVAICDEGIGIPREKLPHIFDEHYRTKEAVQHNKESSGLGLAIVRHVAELHGIRLRVESRPGEQTTFELRFPSDGCPLADLTNVKENENGVSDDCG